jgi:hypothetical protein
LFPGSVSGSVLLALFIISVDVQPKIIGRFGRDLPKQFFLIGREVSRIDEFGFSCEKVIRERIRIF